MIDTLIADASGVLAILASVAGVWRHFRSQIRKWKEVAERLEQANEDLKDQNRDLRMMALIDERLQRLDQRKSDDR